MATDTDTVNFLSQVDDLLWQDDRVVCVKINIPERYGISLEEDLALINWQLIWNFLLENFKFDPVASVVGVHYTGKHSIRHIHWNIISKVGIELSNVSTYKSHYLQKMNATSWFNRNYEKQLIEKGWKVSFRQNTVKDEFCKYNFFIYPLKEKVCISEWANSQHLEFLYHWDTGPMSDKMLQWFKDLGNEIYSHVLARRQREALRVKRHESALFRLFDFCSENRSKYNSLQSLRMFLDTHFLATIPLEEMPDSVSFLKEVKKVAMKLGVWAYSQE